MSVPRIQVDLSKVDQTDRSYVKNIINGVRAFEDPMPVLAIAIYAPDDHYNISFIGWDQEIDILTLYEQFLQTHGPNKRLNIYDYIISIAVIPNPGTTYSPTNDEKTTSTGPVVLFRIKRGALTNNNKKTR